MRYLKLFEEFKGSRITLTSEEKKRLREITRILIKHCGGIQTSELTNGIHEKYTLQFDLGELKNLISGNYIYLDNVGVHPDAAKWIEEDNIRHKEDGYKIVDNYAKKLSEERGTEIVFDRENGCFITKSGKAMTTVNVVSEYPNGDPDSVGGYRSGARIKVFIDYETGDITNNFSEKGSKHIDVWDFSGDNIFMSINQNIRAANLFKDVASQETGNIDEKPLLMDIFSTLFHEFTHSKDPLAWCSVYLGNKEIYGAQNGGVYSSHDTEVQTFSNQFLEMIEYYFERTLRGDKDGNGVNYNLRKEDISNVFIPNILEIVDFVNGNRDELSNRVEKALSGDNKTHYDIKSTYGQIVDMRTEDPEEGKVIRQWMRDDFTRHVDYYNTKVIEINKRKEAGQELPLLHKGFPFEVTELKPTPKNVDKVTHDIENRPPINTIPVAPTRPVTPNQTPNRPVTPNQTPNRPVTPNQTPNRPVPAKPIINREPAKPTNPIDPFTGRPFIPNRATPNSARPVAAPNSTKPSFDSTKLKFAAASKNQASFDVKELINLVDKYSRILPKIYSKCFSTRYAGAKADAEVEQRLQTLFREVKTKDPVRIKETVKSFFDNIGPKLSDVNVKTWLQSSDGRKWVEAISRFEQLCSMA
jgi:hypothetical protein